MGDFLESSVLRRERGWGLGLRLLKTHEYPTGPAQQHSRRAFSCAQSSALQTLASPIYLPRVVHDARVSKVLTPNPTPVRNFGFGFLFFFFQKNSVRYW